MLRDSGLLDDLEAHTVSPTGEATCLYGDLNTHIAFICNVSLQSLPWLLPWKTATSRVRTSVEWVFGGIVNSFKFLDFKKNLKIGLSPCGKHYIVGALLRNALTQTCLQALLWCKTKGTILRSKTRWHEQGQCNTWYFRTLEKLNYCRKTDKVKGKCKWVYFQPVWDSTRGKKFLKHFTSHENMGLATC